jgi:hypothetical protein
LPPDPLWATTQERGEPTALITCKKAIVDGKARIVRITLNKSEFISWEEYHASHLEWTYERIEAIEQSGRKLGSNSDDWWCLDGVVPITNVVSVHTKSWTNNQWKQFDIVNATLLVNNEWLGVAVEGRTYYSKQETLAHGNRRYEIGHVL